MSFECLGDWPGPDGQRYLALYDTSASSSEERRPQYRCAVSWFCNKTISYTINKSSIFFTVTSKQHGSRRNFKQKEYYTSLQGQKSAFCWCKITTKHDRRCHKFCHSFLDKHCTTKYELAKLCLEC